MTLSSRSAPRLVTVVAEWMGHSGLEITWRHYSYMLSADVEVGRAVMRSVWDLLGDSCAISVPSAATDTVGAQ
jgi:hypothetical protein